MFGKPQWFRPKTRGWGLVPVKWQGWLYAIGWGGAIGLPFLLLIGRHQPLEALIWMVLTSGGLALDVRQILCGIRGPRGGQKAVVGGSAPGKEDILYILDSPPSQPVATKNYQLRVQS